MPHAVARLRDQRLARSKKPFLARGALLVRCERCRVSIDYCMCAWRPEVTAKSAVCLLMYDAEPLKPTNTGWLIADVVPDTFAFGWSRTEVDQGILELLADPQWQPYVVFPEEYVPAERVVHTVPNAQLEVEGKRPLFIVLDGTWTEARKMFRKSAYLADLPVLSLQPDDISRYRLRRSTRDEHLCTAEVTALCLHLAEDSIAGAALEKWFSRFSRHYLASRKPPSVAEKEALRTGTAF
ncbi:tRNA-uridine aminocarboxypropyltransferase [Denitrificimonas sp. JX-1]|uniref:tRNA-uridine aminocarboxypropyltransferase n=1 Tax=Denitrificimonas halotolerans TaxID=3098930 RepID=A0ABU5GSS7_9GAMM|nr:tRNA-uridine aminocarboxypropyltransferase [Denitrificimonas sp. JX-1]MDY7220044.1 tRNA-uridine aminocarboxypropyltransferase [Denitrificimonas sp. JX-1]